MPEVTPITGRPGYFASREGGVFSSLSGKLKELVPLGGSSNGRYRYVNLGRGCRLGVHQIIATCFLPIPDELKASGKRLVVRHRDNNPSNNHVDNLRWGTQKQNLADRVEHGTMTLGCRNGAAKVTDAVVIEIRRRRAAGETCRSIAAVVHLSASQVHRIGLGQRWGHIPSGIVPRQRTRRESHASAVQESK